MSDAMEVLGIGERRWKSYNGQNKNIERLYIASAEKQKP